MAALDYFPGLPRRQEKRNPFTADAQKGGHRLKRILSRDWLLLSLLTVAASCWITWPSWDQRPTVRVWPTSRRPASVHRGMFGQVNDKGPWHLPSSYYLWAGITAKFIRVVYHSFLCLREGSPGKSPQSTFNHKGLITRGCPLRVWGRFLDQFLSFVFWKRTNEDFS